VLCACQTGGAEFFVVAKEQSPKPDEKTAENTLHFKVNINFVFQSTLQ
jgi:hypothetical protein